MTDDLRDHDRWWLAAHVITAEADLAAGHPEIIVMIHDSETGEAIQVANYPLSDGDDPADLLRGNGWRVLDDPSQVYTCVEIGYDILPVDPVDDELNAFVSLLTIFPTP